MVEQQETGLLQVASRRNYTQVTSIHVLLQTHSRQWLLLLLLLLLLPSRLLLLLLKQGGHKVGETRKSCTRR